MIKKYIAYLIRWQLSTPILAICIIFFVNLGTTWSTIIANLIGGLLFFWVDKFIFTSKTFNTIWDIKENEKCNKCGKIGRVYRLIKYYSYDRINDKNPIYLCEKCSKEKFEIIKNKGIKYD